MENKALAKGKKQYVIFRIADQDFGADIHKVSIIEKTMNITRVPTAPSYITGVVNLRGDIIPVMDLRIKFGLEPKEPDDDTRIIMFKLNDVTLGVMVDSVDEVVNFDDTEIESVTNITNDRTLDYIAGVGKSGGRIATLLHIEKLITELIA